jgi:transcription elongation factor
LVSRFAAESIVHRADNQVFRYSYYSRDTRGTRWEDRDASIVVTKQSVFIHKNEKVGLDLTTASRKANEVRREGDRVIVSSGSGQSRVSWSFRPPDDAEAWARDIRAVLGRSPKDEGRKP